MSDYHRTYIKYYSPLCNYAFAIVHNLQDAEDLVQDVFVDCIKNQRLKGVKYVERYLLRAVKFSCFDYLKKQRLLISLNSLDKDILDSRSSDDEPAKVYTYIIASLPVKTRQVFLLHRESGLAYKEIAEELNISIKTVEGQMSRAIRICRRILKNLDLI